MIEKEKKQLYEAPRLTVVSFKAERGYASSDPTKLFTTLAITSAYQSEGYQDLEKRGTSTGWTW